MHPCSSDDAPAADSVSDHEDDFDAVLEASPQADEAADLAEAGDPPPQFFYTSDLPPQAACEDVPALGNRLHSLLLDAHQVGASNRHSIAVGAS